MKFDGQNDWNDWTYCEAGLQLAISLTDEAREVLGSLPSAHQHDYDILVDALTRRFSPEGRESQYSLELMNNMCKSDQSVTAYGHTLRRLANRAYPGQIVDKILVDFYMKGLPNQDMKRHVYLAKPKTLVAAINCAVTFEAFDNPATNNMEKLRKPKPNISALPMQKQKLTEDHSDPMNIDVAQFMETVAKMNETVTVLNTNVNKLANNNMNRQRGTKPPMRRDNIVLQMQWPRSLCPGLCWLCTPK